MVGPRLRPTPPGGLDFPVHRWQFADQSRRVIPGRDPVSASGLVSAKPAQWTVLSLPGLIALFQVTGTAETGPLLYTLTAKTTQLTLANGQALVNQLGSSVLSTLASTELAFANEAYFLEQVQGTLTAQVIYNYIRANINYSALVGGVITTDLMLAYIVSQTRSTTAFVQSNLLTTVAPLHFALELRHFVPAAGGPAQAG